MAKSKRPTFTIDGKEYLADPDMEEFLNDAGYTGKSTRTKMFNTLKKNSVSNVTSLFTMSIKDLSDSDGISETAAKKIFVHAQRVRRKGALVVDYEGLKKRERGFRYLPTGSSSLDGMLTYSNGKIGFRSKTLIELYAPPASGKTQICYTSAAMVMRPEKLGGWGQGVAYIDSEGSFEGIRFKYLARYWGVDEKFISDHLLYSRVDSFDDVEQALTEVSDQIESKNIGIIILDSIMDPLKSQYPVGGQQLSNLQPRQKHLKKITDKLKSLADIHNLVAIYTNHVRSNIGTNPGEPEQDAQGGAVLGHASDIRIMLDRPTNKQLDEFKIKRGDIKDLGLKPGRATIKDCGFLPENVGFFIIGPFGVGDPVEINKLEKQAEEILKKGYLCVDSKGNELPPMDDSAKMSREDQIKSFRDKLYAINKQESEEAT
ncbi:MAG: hypothetical protein ACXADH_04545 [Candidatus Kariarchaeaceae archaeon]|jgi:RecA/RadA recombinase